MYSTNLQLHHLFSVRFLFLVLFLALSQWTIPAVGISYPRLEIPETSKAPIPGLKVQAKVCIVCSEFAGIVPNGGIGTFYSTLAESLVGAGHHVTLLYTQGTKSHHPHRSDFAGWHAEYAAKGIELVPLPPHRAAGSGYHPATSFQVLEWLRPRSFDVIHFADWQGHGYYTLLAKHQGLGFERSTLCLMVHGPLRWARDSNQQSLESIEDLEVDFMEQQSIQLADMLLSPSNYLLSWITQQGWRLASSVHVQPYILPQEARRAVQAALSTHQSGKFCTSKETARSEDEGGCEWKEREQESEGTRGVPPPWGGRVTAPDRQWRQVNELVFFGRLEVRKGVVLFCDALDLLTREPPGRPGLKVTFLGSDRNNVGNLNGGEYARQRAKHWPGVETEVVTGLDTAGALAFLLGGDRLAVLPSLVENSPLSLLELMGAGIPFAASTAGGIPEAIHISDHGEVLFPPTLHDLTAKLKQALKEGMLIPRPAVAVEANEQHWINWHQAHAGQAEVLDADAPLDPLDQTAHKPSDHLVHKIAPREQQKVDPKAEDAGAGLSVSVVVASADTGTSLRATLRSLLDQQLAPAEVALAALTWPPVSGDVALGAELYTRLVERGWSWMHPPNQMASLGELRAWLVEQTSGDQVVVADAGSYLEANAIGALQAAAVRSSAGSGVSPRCALAAAFTTLYAGDLPGEGALRSSVPSEAQRLHVFLGPAAGVGAFRNCFGSVGALLVGRGVINASGGLHPYLLDGSGTQGGGYEIWETLARLTIEGYPFGMIPESLAWVRPQPGMYRSRNDPPAGIQLALSSYLARIPEDQHGRLKAAASLGDVPLLKPGIPSCPG